MSEKVQVYCPKHEREVEIDLGVVEQIEAEKEGAYHPRCPKYPLGCGTCDIT